MSSDIKCPFCGEIDFDLVGLKHHFEMGYCDVYNSTLSIEEERALRNAQKQYQKEHENEGE
jgi:hypothetical protein